MNYPTCGLTSAIKLPRRQGCVEGVWTAGIPVRRALTQRFAERRDAASATEMHCKASEHTAASNELLIPVFHASNAISSAATNVYSTPASATVGGV
ncbi:unnamed protein product [Ceratitis capitata]|uniref:(Mediterranean fruit fly) hypothetical protein n=1 Tax=Ceratitis capitata TaxID=7213 RepID=A0A811UVC3_CERCA|nr:unnamed protein product [Ceratitis capitata]